MYKKYNNPSTQGTLGTWRNNGCCEHPENEENEDVVQSIEDVDSDNTIDISTTITISQTATSAGGAGGAGGDGGEGGDASQANGLIAVAINEIEAGIEIPTVPEALGAEDTVSTEQLQQLEKSRPQQNEDGTTASGGDANGGAGGDGGNATSLNYASVVVDNVVIINSNVDGDGQYPAYTIGTGNRKLEIRLDENGETFVNGTKMDEQTLGDGTKVLIFRDSKVNNS
jgi:hypothetical protein